MKIWLDLPFLAFLVCQLGSVSIKALFNCCFSVMFLGRLDLSEIMDHNKTIYNSKSSSLLCLFLLIKFDSRKVIFCDEKEVSLCLRKLK